MPSWACLSGEELKRSWTFFDEAIDLKTNEAKAICKHCSKSYAHPRTNTNGNWTSSLSKHIKTHEEKELQKSKEGSMDKFLKSNKNMRVLAKVDFDAILLETAVTCNWSFYQFDVPQFKYFLSRAFPEHRSPGRKYVKSLLAKAATKAREEIKERLAAETSKISLALDCWTSDNCYEFMGKHILSFFFNTNSSNYISLCRQQFPSSRRSSRFSTSSIPSY